MLAALTENHGTLDDEVQATFTVAEQEAFATIMGESTFALKTVCIGSWTSRFGKINARENRPC
jgi:hypothetical protein